MMLSLIHIYGADVGRVPWGYHRQAGHPPLEGLQGIGFQVCAAMHLSKGVRDGVLRISFGPENTRQEVDQLAQALLEATRDLVPARRCV